jgi:hypothetical protein
VALVALTNILGTQAHSSAHQILLTTGLTQTVYAPPPRLFVLPGHKKTTTCFKNASRGSTGAIA